LFCIPKTGLHPRNAPPLVRPLLNHLTSLLSNLTQNPAQKTKIYPQKTGMYIKSQMERIFSGAWKEKHGEQESEEELESSTPTPLEVRSSRVPSMSLV